MDHNAKPSQRASSVKTAHKVIWKRKLFLGNCEGKRARLKYKRTSLCYLNLIHELFNVHRSLEIKVGIRSSLEYLHGISQVKVERTWPELFFKIRIGRDLNLPFRDKLLDVSI